MEAGYPPVEENLAAEGKVFMNERGVRAEEIYIWISLPSSKI